MYFNHDMYFVFEIARIVLATSRIYMTVGGGGVGGRGEGAVDQTLKFK